MRIYQYLFFLIFLFSLTGIAAQSDRRIQGRVIDSSQIPIPNVNIFVEGTDAGTVTDLNGNFQLKIKGEDLDKNLIFRHIQYDEKKVAISSIDIDGIVIVLEYSLRVLDEVNIEDKRIEEINENVSTFNLDPIHSQFIPAPFQDISSLLITLPGVSSNNEFSTGYAVRGGNFDENLVYVNNIPVYRPQIITSGQQEGLSFINTDLVQGIEFSSGGWEAKYGDGLASTLNIKYKKPTKFGGSLNVGLLGGSVHVEGNSKSDRFTYLVGARHKSSAYLLNTLETKGEYKPRFTDIQTYLNYDISKKKRKGQNRNWITFLLCTKSLPGTSDKQGNNVWNLQQSGKVICGL